MRFPVAEHFASINGEGLHAGQLALFVRFRGCNLACSYCDTAWANHPDCPVQMLSGEDIALLAKEAGVRRITLTGGEPLLQPGLADLVNLLLQDEALAVEVETNGSMPLDELCATCIDRSRLTVTLDCKLPSSGMSDGMLDGNYPLLQAHDVVKFVIGCEDDFPAVLETVRTQGLQQRCHVYLSPVYGQMPPARIVRFMQEEGLNEATLQLQLHKIVWPAASRGV